jgi:uncharacterized membrane protein YjfL (UPF0719 family)
MKNNNPVLGILLHGFFLVSVNLFSLAGAFALLHISSIPSDKLIQASIALCVNLVVYMIVYSLMKAVQKELIEITDFAMLSTVFLISLALMPVIFYPLHFAARGSWSTFDNLLAIWPFQMLVNGLCLVLNFFVLSRKARN